MCIRDSQKLREMDDELVKIYSALTFVPAEDADLKQMCIRDRAYTLELLVLFMLQETPGLLPPLFGARPVPVSYTHLDVYKRQEVPQALLDQLEAVFSRSGFT